MGVTGKKVKVNMLSCGLKYKEVSEAMGLKIRLEISCSIFHVCGMEF